MSNIFKKLTTNIAPFIVIAWPLALVLFLISVFIMIEDYQTSVAGYQLLPTKKVGGIYIVYAISLVPLLGQIVFGHFYGRDNTRKNLLLLIVFFFSVDYFTDVYYKSNGFESFALTLYAMLESFAVFTVGSEVLFTICGGFLIEAWDDFYKGMNSLVETFTQDEPPQRRN